MLPLAIGLMGVGAAGSAYGLLKPRQKYQSASFSDIDLESENPELYAQIQKYEALGNELQALYNQRRQGPSASELRMRDDQLSDLRNNLASRGGLGGSTSFLAERDLNDNFQQQVMARAFQEQQALMAQRAALQQGVLGAYGNAQNAIMNNMNQANLMDYQSRMAQDQARNQFFMGLMGGGAGMAGNSMLAANQAKNTQALQGYQGVPQQQYVAPSQPPPGYYDYMLADPNRRNS